MAPPYISIEYQNNLQHITLAIGDLNLAGLVGSTTVPQPTKQLSYTC